MKILVVLAVTALVLVQCANGLKTAKSRNTKPVYHKKHMEEIEEKLEKLKLMEAELEKEIIEEEYNDDDDEDEEIQFEEEDDEDNVYDPCQDKFCGAGRECIVTEDGVGVCICQAECDEPAEDRRKVCSNHNETWPSDCELYRQRCLCAEEEKGCTNPEYKHVHIDYYGHCQEIPECESGELEDFPRRMTEWLFSIMRDLADRQSLSNHYLKLEKEAESDENKKWSYAVVWKWCDLDGHPKDKAISRHELFPLRAPLYTLEHCISPFLDSCDSNDDHFITLKEWAACLKLDVENMEDLEDLCEDIRE